MDPQAFDRITAALGNAASRRAGIGAAIGAAAAAALGKAGRARAAAPGAAGPCGKGRRKNLCERDGDCCTGICENGLDNLDGKGRCRCRKRGQDCAEDRNCCSRGGQNMVCLGGVCGSACIELGAGCIAGQSVCCAGSCATQGAGWERGFAAVCCLAADETGCSADSDCCQDNGQLACSQGTCQHLD